MKITPREAILLGIWEELSYFKNIDVHAIREGLIDQDEELEVNAEKIKYWLVS